MPPPTTGSGDDETSGRYHRFEQWFTAVCATYAYQAVRFSLGFIFVWYGAQKPFIPGSSPVHRPVAAFAEALGLGVLPGPTGL